MLTKNQFGRNKICWAEDNQNCMSNMCEKEKENGEILYDAENIIETLSLASLQRRQ